MPEGWDLQEISLGTKVLVGTVSLLAPRLVSQMGASDNILYLASIMCPALIIPCRSVPPDLPSLAGIPPKQLLPHPVGIPGQDCHHSKLISALRRLGDNPEYQGTHSSPVGLLSWLNSGQAQPFSAPAVAERLIVDR